MVLVSQNLNTVNPRALLLTTVPTGLWAVWVVDFDSYSFSSTVSRKNLFGTDGRSGHVGGFGHENVEQADSQPVQAQTGQLSRVPASPCELCHQRNLKLSETSQPGAGMKHPDSITAWCARRDPAHLSPESTRWSANSQPREKDHSFQQPNVGVTRYTAELTELFCQVLWWRGHCRYHSGGLIFLPLHTPFSLHPKPLLSSLGIGEATAGRAHGFGNSPHQIFSSRGGDFCLAPALVWENSFPFSVPYSPTELLAYLASSPLSALPLQLPERKFYVCRRSAAISAVPSLLKCLTLKFSDISGKEEQEKVGEGRAKQYFWDDVSASLLFASCSSLKDGQTEICSVINHTFSSWQCKMLPGLGRCWVVLGSGLLSTLDLVVLGGTWPMSANWTAGPSPGRSSPEEIGFPL